MSIKNALASVAVNNIEDATNWYQKMLGRPADATPMPGVAEWKFEGGGWLQVYEGAERAGHTSVTLAVDDIDQQVQSLRQAGIDPGQPIDSPQSRVRMVKDLDGNSIAFAQALDPAMAH